MIDSGFDKRLIWIPRHPVPELRDRRGDIARAVNAAEAIPLEDAPRGYTELDSGAATKYVLNPDGYVAA